MNSWGEDEASLNPSPSLPSFCPSALEFSPWLREKKAGEGRTPGRGYAMVTSHVCLAVYGSKCCFVSRLSLPALFGMWYEIKLAEWRLGTGLVTCMWYEIKL